MSTIFVLSGTQTDPVCSDVGTQFPEQEESASEDEQDIDSPLESTSIDDNLTSDFELSDDEPATSLVS